LKDVDAAALSPLMRALLVVDGTVTKILEAFFLEPVRIQRLAQSVESITDGCNWLEATAGDDVMHRKVTMIGAISGRVYAFAESRIMQDRLSQRVQRRLEETELSLGRILLEDNAETRRECLWYGRECVTDVPETFVEYSGHEFVCRTYRIIAGGRPLMVITEHFPADVAY